MKGFCARLRLWGKFISASSRASKASPLLLALSLVGGCGLDDYPYIQPIPSGNVIIDFNTSATIPLPEYQNYFTNFVIFYRIYISGNETFERIDQNAELMRVLNPNLKSHFDGLFSSTDQTITNKGAFNVSSFRTRGFYELELENVNIDSILSSSGRLVLNFPLTDIPYMELGEKQYRLFRSKGKNASSPFETFPEESRYFLNYLELTDSLNISSTDNKNNDVADAPTGTPESPRYTYVMMYIIVYGFNPATLTTINSDPTFIGIFRIPESN